MNEVESGKVKWEWIGQAWELFTANPGIWIGMELIMAGVMIAVMIPVTIVIVVAGYFLNSMNLGLEITSIVFGIIYLAIYVIMLVTALFLSSGIYKTAIKQAKGEAISVKGVFSGKDVFLKFLGFALIPGSVFIGIAVLTVLAGFITPLLSTLIFIGGLLIMAPVMLCFTTLTYFAPAQMADSKAGVIQAIKVSTSITKKHIFMYFLLAIATGALAEVGLIGLGFGILVTLPFAFLIPAVAYCDVFKLKGAGTSPVPPPPPDHWMAAGN